MFDPDAAGRTVMLPDARKLKLGSPVFMLVNNDDTFSFDVLTADSAVLLTLAVKKSVSLSLAGNTTLAGVWLKMGG